MRATWRCVFSLVALLGLTGLANVRATSSSWDNWRFLVGEWEAAGHGSPGEGMGRFSFAFDLQGKVIVRKSHTDYPAAAGRPAFSHDDLMIIYADDGEQKFRADYYDNEGHVIRYTALLSSDGRTVSFISDIVPAQPRFRLTYTRTAAETLSIKFEIAPPGAQENFKVYVEGTAHKKN